MTRRKFHCLSVLPHVLGLLVYLALPTTLLMALPENFHQVDQKVWRSGQPDKRDFAELKKSGIDEILNLREFHDDRRKLGETVMQCHRVPMNTGRIKEEELIQAVKILRDSKGPILVHCWHGSDRTGTVVALYRMVVCGWTRERAITEFVTPGFGYHAGTYPQLRQYLEGVDIAGFKKLVEAK